MQPWQQYSAGRWDRSLPVHKGVAQPAPSPLAWRPHGHGSVLRGGCLAQGVRTLWARSFRAVLRRAPCPGQQGPEWGAGDEMARALLGSVCRGRVCRDLQIGAQLICGHVPFGRSGGLAFFSETDPQCPRPWGGFLLRNWPDPLALKQPLVLNSGSQLQTQVWGSCGATWWALEVGEEPGGTDEGQSGCSGPGLGWILALGKAGKRGEKWRGLLSMANVWGFAGELGQGAEGCAPQAMCPRVGPSVCPQEDVLFQLAQRLHMN